MTVTTNTEIFKMTKGSFEKKLMNKFEGLGKSLTNENIMKNGTPVSVSVTLYYNNFDNHVGSWSKGKGWIF